ncbi:MAG: hypothetical protein WBV94_28360 [Blastocatellia bacterium]
MKRLREWICVRTDAYRIDDELYEQSGIARMGQRAIQLAVIVRAIEPVLVIAVTAILMITTAAHPAFAQTPGGSIFGGNDQSLGNGVREAIKWGRNLLFLLGVVGVGWGIFNLMTERAWGRQIIGGLLCLGFGGAVSLIYSFSQGNAVNLDTDLGN